MNTIEDIETSVSRCSYGDWEFRVHVETNGRPYLQVVAPEGVCNVTGQPFRWKGRKWHLSYFMTHSEIVQTCFKAVLTAVEHEAREKFLYEKQPIFGPHFDVDDLHYLCLMGWTDERD